MPRRLVMGSLTLLLIGVASPAMAAPGNGGVVAAPTAIASAACGTDLVHPPLPPNVDASTLDAASLQAYGFPARPAGSSSSPSVLGWVQALRAARTYVAPSTPVCPATGSTTFTAYSGNWAGYYVKNSALKNYSITTASSEFTVPRVAANSNYSVSSCGNSSGLPPNVAPWVGIGGVTEGSLIQTGIVACSSTTATYRMWTEDLPQAPRYEGVSISPGNLVYVVASYEGGGKCTYYQENVTSGKYTSHTHTDCSNVASKTADFVIERAGAHYLPTFATFNQYFNYAGTTKVGVGGDLYQYAHTQVVMTSNCTSSGTVLSDSSAVSSSNDGFNHYHRADDPVCG